MLDNSNNWRHVWEDLDANRTWTVDEINVPTGYTKAITGNVRDGFVITNTLPKKPTEPNKPDKPSEPEEPDKPTEPVEPDKPTEPVEPDKPTEPVEPDKPTKPVEPGKPSEPDKPSKPISPGALRPKTSDDTDVRPWLIILAVCACVLRYTLFMRKNGDEGKQK
jgi:hypothetical protein